LLCVTCRPAGTGVTDLTFFDGIITKEVVAAGYRPSVPLTFTVHADDSTRVYVGEYEFPRTDPADHYTASITVAKAGALLDPETYAADYEDTKRNSADRSAEYLLSQFPRIGKRAHWDLSGAGPGGAYFGLTFTTSDGRYDVRIVVSNLLPASVKHDPEFDIEATARRISELYDSR
jgi:hypothetical protein